MVLKLALVREGATDLFVPAESLQVAAPRTFPAFFNPAARINRDISVAVAKVTKPSSFLDALGGIGARGVRVANEASKRVSVTMVEFNKNSSRLAKESVKKNRLSKRCFIVGEETNAYLHSRFGRLERFDAVDVDPFGTPAPFVQGALNASRDGGIVSLTATDTATLCGVYPQAVWRRYGARVARSEFSHEAAIRVLLGFVTRVGGTVDVGIEPVMAHSTLHYLRVYFRVLRGAAKSDSSLRELGFVATCAACHENSLASVLIEKCPRCGGAARSTGPQWLGKLIDEGVRWRAAEESKRLGFLEAAKTLESLEGCDRFPPFGYGLEHITSRERLSSVPFRGVLDSLKASGRLAMRQPFGSSGLKTDASYAEILAAVRGQPGLDSAPTAEKIGA